MLCRLQLMVFIMLIVFLGSIYFSLTYSHISNDAPYYLAVARDISVGYVPYQDIYLSYTPLVMYLNSLVYLAIDDFNYKIFLGFQFLIMLISLIIFFILLVRQFKILLLDSGLISLILGIAILSADGSYINLEVYLLLAIITAIYLFFCNHFFFTGVLVGISFFMKQYGLLNFFPFLLLIYLTKSRPWFKLIHFMLGSLFALMLFLLYFMFIQDVPVDSILDQLSGIKYIKQVSKELPSIYSWILGIKVFIILFTPIVFSLRSRLFTKKNLPWLFGILINVIPTFLQAFQHYVILTFPYLFVLLALNWKSTNTLYLKSLFISGFALAILLNVRNLRYKNVYYRQIYLAEGMKNYVPSGSAIFLNGGVRTLYLQNNYENPLRQSVGYSYFHYLKTKDFTRINILSNKRLQEVHTERISIDNRFFYLKL